MSINTTASRITYAGNGISLAFAFPYYFLKAADLVVLSTDANGIITTLVLNTDYTVSGAAEDGTYPTGTVTTTVAPATGVTLTIYRDPAEVQNLTLVQNDPLPAAELEKAYDLGVMLTQRLKDRLDRAAVLPDGFSTPFSTTLPTTPNAVVAVNSNGNGLTAGPTVSQIAAAAIAAAAAIPSVCKSYASDAAFVAAQGSVAIESNFYYNSVDKSFRMYLNGSWRQVTTDTVTPELFGAVGDGVTDDTVAIQAALTAIPSTGGDVFLSKTYKITAPLVPKNNTRILGARGAILKATATISAAAAHGYIEATDLQNFKIQGVHFQGPGAWTNIAFANPYSAGNSVGFTNDDYGIKANVSTGANGISIEDCYFEGLSRAVVINQNGSGLFAKNVNVSKCRITNMGFGGIFLYQTSRFVVEGNLVEKVYGNITAAGDTSTANSKFGDGIGLNSATDGVVANNSVYDFQRCGLIIEPYANPTADGTTTNGNANLTNVAAGTVTTLAALLVDKQTVAVIGTGVPTGTTVSSAAGTTVVMSGNATASATVSIQYVVYSSRITMANNVINYQHDGRGAQDWAGIYVSDGSVQQPISIADNTIYNIFGASAVLLNSVNGDGIVVEDCQVSGGSIKNCGGNGLDDSGGENTFSGVKVYNCNLYGLRVVHTFSGNLTVSDCEFISNGFAGINLAECDNSFIRITGCLFKDNGSLTTPLGSGNEGIGLSGITVPGAGSTEVLIIERNTFISSANTSSTVGQLYGISIYVSGDFNELIRDNMFIFTHATTKNTLGSVGVTPCCFATDFNTGGYTCYDLFPGLFARGNDNNKKAWTNSPDWIGAASSGYLRILGYATSAPGAGTYRTGDAFLNSAISGGSLPFIWVCTTAGTPGTWKSLTLA